MSNYHSHVGSQPRVVANYDPLVSEAAKLSASRLAAPARSHFSRLSTFNYVCDVNPNCDIKALKSKNLGSEPDPDPTSLLKLRFRRKTDRVTASSQGGPSSRGAMSSKRLGSTF